MMIGLAEIFYSVQGEGAWTGTPAIFVRLAGCNLACAFCDTDYALRFLASVPDIVAQVRAAGGDCPMVILTGGEPLAQTQTTGGAFTSKRTARSTWNCRPTSG